MFERWLKLYSTLLLLLFSFVVPAKVAHAQQLNIDVEPSALLEGSQVLSLSNLGVSTDGSGPVLVSVTIENISSQRVEDLFLEIIVTSGKAGTLVEYTQESHRPFSLRPSQSIYITNNDIANEVFPGIDETVSFSGGLTPAGDDLIGDLSGSTTLPQDRYTMEVILFTVNDAEGRRTLARDAAEIGGGSDTSPAMEDSEIILRTPGDVVGSEGDITNPYPQFTWEGDNSVTYRLLVVEDNEQDSPQSLLQSAKSSTSIDDGGSLLEFENLDVFVEGTSFQFPSSGVQPLERGETYYWQVLTTVQSSGDQNEVLSEVWNFTLQDQSETSASSVATNSETQEELERTLIEIIGQENFQQLNERGFTLESIEYDGQQFSGASAMIKLEELLQQIRDEEIILQGN